jgi:hypothetical protein
VAILQLRQAAPSATPLSPLNQPRSIRWAGCLGPPAVRGPPHRSGRVSATSSLPSEIVFFGLSSQAPLRNEGRQAGIAQIEPICPLNQVIDARDGVPAKHLPGARRSPAHAVSGAAMPRSASSLTSAEQPSREAMVGLRDADAFRAKSIGMTCSRQWNPGTRGVFEAIGRGTRAWVRANRRVAKPPQAAAKAPPRRSPAHLGSPHSPAILPIGVPWRGALGAMSEDALSKAER